MKLSNVRDAPLVSYNFAWVKEVGSLVLLFILSDQVVR